MLNPSSIIEVNPEVFYCKEALQRVDRSWIFFLKEKASQNRRKRARICLHKDPKDSLHEMLIALHRSNYVRPHKHLGRSESFHLVEGEMDVIVFDDSGRICHYVPLGVPLGEEDSFFSYRLSEARFHTVLVRSQWVIFYEVTSGPFDKGTTLFPDWAPAEESEASAVYLNELEEDLRGHVSSHF